MNEFYQNTFAARLRRRLNSIVHAAYLDLDQDPSSSVFICSVGRSGSTWLADLVNHDNAYRYMYEPFNNRHVPACRYFSYRQYLRPGDNDPRFLEPATAIFRGRIRTPWIDQYNRRVVSRRRLIKDVRSTLMLKWVRDHFPQMRIVYLLRHPCAVALSRARRAPGRDRRGVLLEQEALVTDHLAPFVEKIRLADTPFERHLVGWCAENYVPFKQLARGDVFLMFYENIVATPLEELRRLFSFLGRPIDEAVLERYDRPSVNTRKDSAVFTGASRTDAWRSELSASEIAAARRIIDSFGLDDIYRDDTSANRERAERLLKATARH